MRRRLTIVSFAAVGCCAAVISVASVLLDSGTAGAASPERRPDLVQRTPTGVGVLESDGRFLLGFDSGVENHGRGPLLVQGQRTAIQRDMTADQLIRRANGSLRRVRGIGVIRYTRSGGHDHWHYLKPVRYELRRLSDHALVRPDRRRSTASATATTGRAFAGKPRRPIYNTNRRLYQPAARSVEMGSRSAMATTTAPTSRASRSTSPACREVATSSSTARTPPDDWPRPTSPAMPPRSCCGSPGRAAVASCRR